MDKTSKAAAEDKIRWAHQLGTTDMFARAIFGIRFEVLVSLSGRKFLRYGKY